MGKADERSGPRVPIGTIKTNVGDEYRVETLVGSGSSGVVYLAKDLDDEQVAVAVKFYLIPDELFLFDTTAQSFWDKGDELAYNRERAALRDLDHPGIQRVLGWGEVSDAIVVFGEEAGFRVPADDKVRFLVTRYIEGDSLSEWINKLNESASQATSPERDAIRTKIITVLVQILEALTYLHETKLHQHSDLRSDNVLIETSSGRPVLIDFGYAQAFDSALIESVPTTRVRPLRLLNAPAELEELLKPILAEDPKAVPREALRDLLFPGLDLYHLGKLFEELLEDSPLPSLITELDREVLTLHAQALVTWAQASTLRTSEVLGQIRKLESGFWAGAATPHAPQLAPGQPVRRIALGEAAFLAPDFVERIIETRSFRRLQQLKQLSLLDFVYPSATQTRFDHSLMVYSTAVELVQCFVRSPRFTRLFDTLDVTKFLLCALLHDVNHFPFLHYCQELDLASGEPLNLFRLFISEVPAGGTGSPTIADVIYNAGADPAIIIDLLTTDHRDLTDGREQVIRSSLDSGVDIDKLCYVQGDARATGVPFGRGVDRRTLLSAADVMMQPGDGDENWHICFRPEALSAVESLLLARYWNFRQVYWHHTNRALGAMVTHVLRCLKDKGTLSLKTYVDEAQAFTEAAALDYLDRSYEEAFGAASILRDLVTRRAGLFKRLLSLRAPWGAEGTTDEERRQQIVSLLQDLSDTERPAVSTYLSEHLVTIFPDLRDAPEADELVVLLDIPGRPLDQEIGAVFVADLALDGHPTRSVRSPFIETLKKEFHNLSRTVRLFIPGSVRDAIGKARILAAQIDLEKLLLDALKKATNKHRSTVR